MKFKVTVEPIPEYEGEILDDPAEFVLYSLKIKEWREKLTNPQGKLEYSKITKIVLEGEKSE